jgi:hypothetical protein
MAFQCWYSPFSEALEGFFEVPACGAPIRTGSCQVSGSPWAISQSLEETLLPRSVWESGESFLRALGQPANEEAEANVAPSETSKVLIS